MSRKVLVAGVGMIPFTKPGRSEHYYEMGAKAIVTALADAESDSTRSGRPTPATCTGIRRVANAPSTARV